MGRQDGIDHALLALAELRRLRSPDWHAILVGDGEVRAEMEALSGELGLSGSVEFAVAQFGRPGYRGRVALAGAAVFGAALIGFAFSPWFPVSLVFLVLCGVFSQMESCLPTARAGQLSNLGLPT